MNCRLRLPVLLLAAPIAAGFAMFGCGSSGNTASPSDGGPGGDARGLGEGGANDGSTSNPDGSRGSPDGGTESGAISCPAADAGFPSGYPAAHASFPDLVYAGGGILAQPEVVTVTFPNDTLAPQLEQFGDDVLQTCWWEAARQGYCSGTGGAAPCVGTGVIPSKSHVELTTPADASYSDSQMGGAATIKTFIQAQVASGAFPAPKAGTIYALYFPEATTLTLDSQKSCVNFGGYHMSTQVTPPGGTAIDVAYAVLPRCGAGSFSSSLDELTFSASHEISEASTDPFAQGQATGFYLDLSSTATDNYAWNFIGGGEVADLCVDLLGEAYRSPLDQFTAVGAQGSYVVQRIWSTAAAAAGGDPCVPIADKDAPYFNVAISKGNGLLQLNVGQQVTFEADAFSTGPLTSWSLAGLDITSLQTGHAPYVTVTPDKVNVTNGDKVMVTVTLNSQPPTLSGSLAGAVFALVSQSGTSYHVWPGLVVQ